MFVLASYLARETLNPSYIRLTGSHITNLPALPFFSSGGLLWYLYLYLLY
jgi:hypothetical protein